MFSNKILFFCYKNWKQIFLCLLVILSSYLYLVNYFYLQNLTSLEQVNSLKAHKVIGQVYYQKSNSKKWNILSGEELLDSDIEIQSSEQSRILLNFNYIDANIEASENSSFSISETPTDYIIDFKKGELFIHTDKKHKAKNLILKIESKFFNLESSDTFIMGNSSQIVELKVSYGRIVMADRDSQNTFTKGQVVFLNSMNDFSVVNERIKIETPLPFEKYYVESADTLKVRFAWTTPLNFDSVQLLIGENINNLSSYFEQPIQSNQPEFVVSLPKGIYYWKLQLYKNKNEVIKSNNKRKNNRKIIQSLELVSETSISKLFIEPLIRIIPQTPEANQNFLVTSNERVINFKWDNPSYLEKSFIEISRNSNFTDLVFHSIVSNKQHYQASFHEEGDYYWRVNGFPSRSSELLTGVSRKFTISRKLTPYPIQILYPKDNTILTTNMILQDEVSLIWKNEAESDRYKVHIEGPLLNGKFKNKYTFSSEAEQLKLELLPAGLYQWYVEGRNGEKSKDFKFQIVETKSIKIINQNQILKFNSSAKNINTFKVDLMRLGSEFNKSDFFASANLKQTLFLKKPELSLLNYSSGLILVKVYGLDDKKRIVSDSSIQLVQLN